jgi:hypothetical protein
VSQSTERQIQLGLRQRCREEAELCDEIAAELDGQGLRVVQQHPTMLANARARVDLAVLHPSGSWAVELIEVKVNQPYAGIGQLLGYQHGLVPTPRLTLAIPPALHGLQALAYACEMAGVRLWEYEPAEYRARRERFAAGQDDRARQKAALLREQGRADREWRQLVRSVQAAQERATRTSQER